MKPLKTAIVVGTFPTVSETFIVNQIVGLVDLGHEVTIFSYRKGLLKNIHPVVSEYGLLDNVIYFQKKSSSKWKRIIFFISYLWANFNSIDWCLLFRSVNIFRYGKKAMSLQLFYESLWFLKKQKQDIVHVHFGTNAVRIASIKALGFLQNTKFITTFHGYDLMPNMKKHYKRHYAILIKESDQITINTLYLKDIFDEIFPNQKNVYILPVGLDTDYFKNELVPNQKGFKILYCGRLIPFKGSNSAIEIMNELVNRGYKSLRLIIIGEGELENVLESKIKECNLEKFILLKGALSQDLVKDEMNQSDIFLLPGIHEVKTDRAETQGLVIQEAQAMQLPVVVSDAGGMKYGLIPNETGFVVKEKDIIGFADAIQRIIKNPDLGKKMGKKGRKFVVNNYDSKVLVKRLLKIYNR